MTPQWHLLSGEEVVNILRSDKTRGLNNKEVRKRKALPDYPAKKAVPGYRRGPFEGQFKNMTAMLLFMAIVFFLALGEYVDALSATIIMLLNSIIGLIGRYQVLNAMKTLKKLVDPTVRVIREGLEQMIPAGKLVMGDIVLLERGDRIPADMRLLETNSLETEESSRTGEFSPVEKMAGLIEEATGPADALNIVYAGTVVIRGNGRGIVVSAGAKKADWSISFGRGLTNPDKMPAILGACACISVALIGIYRGESAGLMVLSGIALAAAAVSGALPTAAAASLAAGVQRMARLGAFVRNTTAVKTLGCVTVVCPKKTGMLTENEMSARKIVTADMATEVRGKGYDPKGGFTNADSRDPGLQLLLKIGALCNNAGITRQGAGIGGLFRGILKGERSVRWGVAGDPTEGALLVMAARGGVWREEIERREQRLKEFSFDSGRKRMTVVCKTASGGGNIYVKGAPEIILELCTGYFCRGRTMKLSPAKKEEIMREFANLGTQSLRVLAMAFRELPSLAAGLEDYEVEKELIFVGLVGISNPLRSDVAPAMQKCRRAGIKVMLVTGESKFIAGKIAGELGILGRDGRILTDVELDHISDQQLKMEVKNVRVFARMSARHKLRIIRALKQNGEVVAVSGNESIDRPAVEEADLGMASLASGPEVTREAAALLLSDDGFNSFIRAVREGRNIYENERKIIRYLLSGSCGLTLTMLLAMAAGMPLPLKPVQILWISLIIGGLPTIVPGFNTVGQGIMNRRPVNPLESVFAHGLNRQIATGGILTSAGAVFLFFIACRQYPIEQCRTIVFNALVFFQLFFALNCRSEYSHDRQPAFFTNPFLLIIVFCSGIFQVAITYLPFFQTFFHTVSLTSRQWAMSAGATAMLFLLSFLLNRIIHKGNKKLFILKYKKQEILNLR